MNKWLKKFIINTTSVAVAVIMLASCSLKDYAVKARNAVPAAIQVTTEETILNQSVDSAVLYGAETTAATSKTEKQYVKDVKFIHGENLAEAKKALPKGYTLLETDLNQGAAYITAVDDVYMAYSTTPNPDEAVTDIKMMNMKGGFVVADYDSQIDNVSANIRAMAQEFKQAVNTFVENYKKGTSGAKAAYVTLSAFTVDEQDNKTLADYFIYSDVPDGFYLKLLLNAHTDILSSVLSALTMAVQGEKGNTWLDRLAKIEDPYGVTNSLYWDQAVALLPHFTSFFTAYDSIDHALFRGPGGPLYAAPDEDGNKGVPLTPTGNNPSVDLTGGEFLYELAHMLLEQYSFGDGSPISEWLVCDWLYQEMLYPLIEVLTPAEYAMMHLCGPLYMIFATAMSESVYLDYTQRAKEIVKEMGGKCSVWAGVNTDLLRSSIGITDEAVRAIVETKAEQEFKDQGDSGMDTAVKAAGLFAAAGAVALGVGMLTVMITGSSLFAGLLGSAAVAFTCKAAVVTSIAGIVCASAGVAAIVVALVIVVIYLVVWVIEWIDGLYPEYTEIPEYMYDYVIDDSDNGQFLLYEVAKDQYGNPADVNAFDGKEWHAPYISRNPAAGAPIEADFLIRLGDGRLDEGYGALSAFGNINCENLNRYAFDDDVNGIFVSYRQEDLHGDYARGKYLSNVHLFTAETEDECKLEIKNKKYSLYNLNLTPNAKYVTYLGYQTTNKADNALTDIRFAYANSTTQYSAGGGNFTYAESGTVGDLTLYRTRISAFGSPITSNFTVVNNLKDAPVGYEPVNMFSGGPATNINIGGLKYINDNTPYYLYFLPSKAYVEGTEYLGGVGMMYDVSWEGYFNGQSSVINAAIEMGYQTLSSVKGIATGDEEEELECSIVITKTYNPYRAIYDVGAMTTGKGRGNYFTETITYHGKGYMLSTRYVVDYKNRVLYDSNIRTNDARLYVAGPCYGGSPLKPGDLSGSSVRVEKVPDGYREITTFLDGSETHTNITSGLNYSYRYGYSMGKTINVSTTPLYMYVRGEKYKNAEAITRVNIVSKEQILAGQDVKCSALDDSYIYNSLANLGSHTVIEKNLNVEDSNNSVYLGYAKDPSVKDPITDMILYYAGKTNEEPQDKFTKNGAEYHLVSEANILCEENNDKKTCKRVYLYTTTNPVAGSPIVDIQIDHNAIVDGWQTVRTQNEKALYDDMDEHTDIWFIHMKRADPEPKYISEIVIGWGSDSAAKAKLLAAGCDYMVARDLNDGVGILSDYIYLGYKRTSDPNQAIRNIIAVHNKSYTSFAKNGAMYHKVEGNLNSDTNYFADDIYLFYTKDPNAGGPLTSLGTSSSVANWSHGEGNRYVVTTVLNQDGKPSDLNDGAFGYYIYLLQTKDKLAQSTVASMIGEGSILMIGIFAAVSLMVVGGIVIVKKKRAKQQNQTNDTQSKNE